MKLSDLKSIIRQEMLKESLLTEEDRTFYATPEHVKQSMEMAFKNQMKKFDKIAKKGYFTSSETERMFTTFGHNSGWSKPDASKQRELRKKYGTADQQDKKK